MLREYNLYTHFFSLWLSNTKVVVAAFYRYGYFSNTPWSLQWFNLIHTIPQFSLERSGTQDSLANRVISLKFNQLSESKGLFFGILMLILAFKPKAKNSTSLSLDLSIYTMQDSFPPIRFTRNLWKPQLRWYLSLRTFRIYICIYIFHFLPWIWRA